MVRHKCLIFGERESLGDGKQELKLYLRRLVPIMEDLIADERFAGHQYLSFERREHNGSRVFGPANGSCGGRSMRSVWVQIESYLAS